MDYNEQIERLVFLSKYEKGREYNEINVGEELERAAKTIESLLDRAERAEKALNDRWISVEERLPTEKEEIREIYDPDTLAFLDVTYHNVSDMVLVFATTDCGEKYVCDDITVDGKWVNTIGEVTHWMPIPEPPNA